MAIPLLFCDPAFLESNGHTCNASIGASLRKVERWRDLWIWRAKMTQGTDEKCHQVGALLGALPPHRKHLRGPRDAQLLHFLLQRRTLHAQANRRTLGTTDNPVRFAEGFENMIAFSVRKRLRRRR
jgi:hypothetical protein